MVVRVEFIVYRIVVVILCLIAKNKIKIVFLSEQQCLTPRIIANIMSTYRLQQAHYARKSDLRIIYYS